jgi:ArsR family transcriptional regulator
MQPEEICKIKNIGTIDINKYEGLELIMSAFSNKLRLAILDALLKNGELCTCELVPATGMAQPTVTINLQKLYSIGIIKKREEWKYTYYSINKKYLEIIKLVLKLDKSLHLK